MNLVKIIFILSPISFLYSYPARRKKHYEYQSRNFIFAQRAAAPDRYSSTLHSGG